MIIQKACRICIGGEGRRRRGNFYQTHPVCRGTPYCTVILPLLFVQHVFRLTGRKRNTSQPPRGFRLYNQSAMFGHMKKKKKCFTSLHHQLVAKKKQIKSLQMSKHREQTAQMRGRKNKERQERERARVFGQNTGVLIIPEREEREEKQESADGGTAGPPYIRENSPSILLIVLRMPQQGEKRKGEGERGRESKRITTKHAQRRKHEGVKLARHTERRTKTPHARKNAKTP